MQNPTKILKNPILEPSREKVGMKQIKNNNHGYESILLVIAIFILLFFLYPLIFETNDDVGMSMLAPGYGLALKSSDNIDLPTRAFPPGYNLYAFGSGYYLPRSVSNQYAFSAHSFSNILKKGNSLKLITRPNFDMSLITEYCKEHLKRHLNIIDVQRLSTFTLYTIQCTSGSS